MRVVAAASRTRLREWMVDIVAGGVLGAIVGAIVAVNVVIYAGPDTGYQSSIGDVFEHDVFVGLLTVTVLLAGPIIGVLVARRRRQREGR